MPDNNLYPIKGKITWHLNLLPLFANGLHVMCLSTGTHTAMSFPFVCNGERIILGVPKVKTHKNTYPYLNKFNEEIYRHSPL